MYETSGHFPYYRDSQFAPIFGHPAGQLIDHWIRGLDPLDTELQTPSSEAEGKLLEAAKLLGFDATDFPVNGSSEESTPPSATGNISTNASC
jgi:threonyl-tRNA synthetase